MTIKEFYYDDRNDLEIEVIEHIQLIMKSFGKQLTEVDEDAICNFFDDLLEKYTNGEYENYN